MEITIPINDISKYNTANHHKTLHPLVSIIDFSKVPARDWGKADTIKFQYGLYCIYLKDANCGDIRYGRNRYDYQAGTLVFFAPGQVATIENPGVPYQPMGHGLLFHADLLLGTSLGKNICNYKFFDYETHEALHVSDDERNLLLDCFAKITSELNRAIDKHSKKLITSNIQLFLDYCQRFYDRQFITREAPHKGVLEKFENLLNQYFESDLPQSQGLPSVAYFAAMCNLSANYFGDLIKKETGITAKDYIHNKMIEVAKKHVFETDKTINEIAFELGFKYPQHFSRVFKQKLGITPNEYRNMN